MSSSSNQNNDISLAVQIQQDGPTLRLSYQVRNLSDRTAYLFDVLHDEFNGSVFPLVEACYASIEQGQLVFSRQIVDVPEGMLLEGFNIPFVTPVRPGRTIEKTVLQPQPVYPWTPYIDRDDFPPAQGVLDMNAYFRIGYFMEAQGTSELARVAETDNGSHPYFDPFPIESQKYLMTGPLGTVRVYDLG
ncbi:hypothetical protein [uncultured Roseibium sp.]|uniref:hypothetical protein n=1 Tax=uncultured Roseibium sp. TaxID=1936171 RepID=UPI002612DC01|nr:hypothetical protein [uncultured Roseibium sp.]